MASTVSVSHKGKIHAVQVDLTSTVSSFQARLEELTSVPTENQKLLFKGKKASTKGDDTLESFGLKDGTKVQILGPTAEEISTLRAIEDEKKRTEQILRNRETQARVCQITLRFTGPASALTTDSHVDIFPFNPIQSLRIELQLSFRRHPTSSPSPESRLGPFVARQAGKR